MTESDDLFDRMLENCPLNRMLDNNKIEWTEDQKDRWLNGFGILMAGYHQLPGGIIYKYSGSL